MYKAELVRVGCELKHHLEGKPNGIPLEWLHRDFNLKGCGMMLDDVITASKDTLEKVTINGQQCLRLKRIVRDSELDMSAMEIIVKSRPKNVVDKNRKENSDRSQKEEKGHQSSTKLAPAALTMPQCVSESEQKKPAPVQNKPSTSQFQGHPINMEDQIQQYSSRGNVRGACRGRPQATIQSTAGRGYRESPAASTNIKRTASFSFDQESFLEENMYNSHKKWKGSNKSVDSPNTRTMEQMPQNANPQAPFDLMSLSSPIARSSSLGCNTIDRSVKDRRYNWRGARTYDRTQLNDYAHNCIVNLAEGNELVTIEKVMLLMKQHFQVEMIEHLGLRHEFELGVIRDFQRLQKKVNVSIQGFIKVRAVATLHELYESLSTLEGRTKFEEHNLGPLAKQPLVYDLFKFPTTKPDSEIPPITTMDVLEVLRQYLTDKNLWRSKVKLEEFLEYVVTHYQVESPFELGIRLQSVGLMISVLKTAQRQQKEAIDTIRNEVKKKVNEECQITMDRIKHAIMTYVPNITGAQQFTPSTGAGLELRKSYVTMTANKAINTVFENVCELIGRNRKLDIFVYHLNEVKQDPLASALFQLALCLGSLEPPKELIQREVEEDDNQGDDDWSDHQIPEGGGSKPTDAEVLEELKRFLNKLIQGIAVPKLRDLASIEKRLCQMFKASNFSNLMATQRTFLEFMALDHPQVLEAFGGSLLGVGSTNPMMGSTYRPSRMDIMEFIRQCDPNKESPEFIASALCSHYQLSCVEELGQGQLAMLMKPLMTSGNTYDEYSRPVTYAAAMCSDIRSCDQREKQVGLLGTQSLERVLGCLSSAPLLEDLAEWIHWELVFEPEHGDIKSFIEKNPGVQLSPPVEIKALETKPGILLKLASHTSPDHFSKHSQNGDAINAAGHLVSLVVQDGIANVPMALLGNHMEAALAKILRKDIDAGKSTLQEGSMVSFAMEMLTRMPTQIAQVVAQQVILRPLISMVGSEAKSIKLLLQACLTSTQSSRLQKLGLLLGINQWKMVIEERFPLTTNDEDDICADDGEADIDVEGLLAAAASTTKVQETKVTTKDKEQISTSDDVIANIGIKTEDVKQEHSSNLDSVKQEMPGNLDGLVQENQSKKDIMYIDIADEKDDILDDVEDVVLIEDGTSDDDDISKEDGSEVEEYHPDIDENNEECQPGMDEDDISIKKELTESQHHVWTCKTVIDNICHNEFGVGMKFNKETKQLMQRHQERISRSLQRLSEELYSRDTHFVLELIQNADDNKYDEGVESSLVFVVDNESVTAMNNERGFSEQDIRALCDVGKSTKGKHKHGYIGHKGIGFKSVFRVTDTPEIHSSGYHVCFEHGKDPMGYILPTWIGPQNVQQLCDFQTNADWATTIKLPLKGDIQRTSSLVNKFQDIQPSLLLFLHRLRSIVIVNKEEGSTRQMKRQDIGSNVVEIKHNKVTDSWLVVKEMLDATKLHRERVESTELALAFPLRAGSSNLNREQSVFAFLPLRSYGFHFIIQGDFDIPSSREDVDSDSAWNQWLRQSIAPLFVNALETFKNHYEEDAIHAVCSFMQFVPLESQILTDFFKKVAVSIHQRLKATQFLPVLSEEQDKIEWKLPSETVMAKDPLIQDVVKLSVLKTHLNCHYLHQAVVEECSTTLLTSLGVKSLQTSDLIDILKMVALRANTSGENLAVETVAKWLACMYRCRERDYDVSQDKLDQLRLIPVIPLTSGQRVAIKDLSVFFPLSADDKVTDQKQFQTGSHVLKAVEADMAMVDARLMCNLDDVANSQIRRMLEELGVRHIGPQEVIQHHILPVLKSDKWQEKTQDVLIGYLVYIKEQQERQPSVCNILTDLKPCVQVMTNHGLCNPAKVTVHFSAAYRNPINLPKDLPGCDWVLLDSCYLTHKGTQLTDRDYKTWQDFFTQLGVLCYLAVESKVVTLKESEMSSSPWASVYSFWPKPANGIYTIEDQACKEFEQLISCNTLDPERQKYQRHKLLIVLHLRWQNIYAKYTTAKLLDTVSGNQLKLVPSSFAIQLQSSPWLPSMLAGKVEYRRPADIFLFSMDLFNFLGPHVPYLTLDSLQPNSTLFQFLHIRNYNCITPDFMLGMLKTWCQIKDGSSITMTTTGLGASFETSLSHIITVYRYLHENGRFKDLTKLYDDYPAIFVPQDPNVDDWTEDKDTPVEGQFVHKHCAYWQDPTGLLKTQQDRATESELPQRFAVGVFYKDLQNIFLTGKLVDQTPTLKEYVVLLVDMVSKVTLPDNDKLLDIHKIYATLGKKCIEHNNLEKGEDSSEKDANPKDTSSKTCKFLRGLLKEEPVFPTRTNKWVTLANKPILCDNESAELEKIFSNNPQVHLLNMADKDRLGRTLKDASSNRGKQGKENVKQFVEACQIQTLTDCVERELIPTLLKPSPNVQLFMYTICPYIQLFIYTRSQTEEDFNDLYQQLQDEHIATQLKVMTIFEVDSLEVVHRMKHDPLIFAKSFIECGIEKNSLYVINKIVPHLQRNTQIRREISKMFTRGVSTCQRELFNFMGNLLLSLEPAHIGQDISDTLCNQLQLDKLDEDTDIWQIPKPIMPEIKKPPRPEVKVVGKLDEKKADHAKSKETKLEGDAGRMHSWPPKSSVLGDAGKLRSWPPKSGPFSTKVDEDGQLKIWPPPAPPQSANPVELPLSKSPASDKTTHTCSSNAGDLQRQSSVSGGGTQDNILRSQSMESQEGSASGEGALTNPIRSQTLESGEEKVFHKQESAGSDISITDHKSGQSDKGFANHSSENCMGEISQHQEQRLDTPEAYLDTDEIQLVSCEERSQTNEEDQVSMLETDSSQLEVSMFETPPQVRHTSGPYTVTPGFSSRRFQMAPMWSVLPNVEVEFENVAKGAEIGQYTRLLEFSPDQDEDKCNKQTGRWGEALVYNYLCQQSEMSGDGVKVIWVNESAETGHPYDIIIEGDDGKVYVEVKATKLDQKQLFEISSKEVAFAEQQKDCFHLYRVYNAGNHDNVRLCRLQNLSLKMDKKEVRLCMYI